MKIDRPLSNQPIPEDAKKVFKGVLFDVYQWEQKMFDGSTQTFEKIKRTDTVVVVPVTDEGKIVMTSEQQPGKKPFISVPGGRVEEGEDILNAAKRELLEETGLVAKEFILWNAIQPVSKIDWAIYTFIAKDCKSDGSSNLDAGEKISLKSVNFDQFIEAALREDFNEDQIRLLILQTKFNQKEIDKIHRLLLG